jgi:hypothetical protein
VEKTQHPEVQGSDGKLASQQLSFREQGQLDSSILVFMDGIP